jgi:hypothetical protein
VPGEEAAHGTATSLPPARIVVVVQVVSATAFSLRAIKADGKTSPPSTTTHPPQHTLRLSPASTPLGRFLSKELAVDGVRTYNELTLVGASPP